MKARVLPLPVFAAPRMSFPFNARGSAFFCISVNIVKCAFLSPSSQLALSIVPRYHPESAVKGVTPQIGRRYFHYPFISPSICWTGTNASTRSSSSFSSRSCRIRLCFLTSLFFVGFFILVGRQQGDLKKIRRSIVSFPRFHLALFGKPLNNQAQLFVYSFPNCFIITRIPLSAMETLALRRACDTTCFVI